MMLVISVIGAGCNVDRYAVSKMVQIYKQAARRLDRSRDPDYVAQAAPANLVALEGLFAFDPRNRDLLELLAKQTYSYTYAFLEGRFWRLVETCPAKAQVYRKRARIHYLKVHAYGLRLLALAGGRLSFDRTGIATLQKKITRLGRSAIAGLVWTAVGAGGAALMGLDEPRLLAWIPKVRVLLERAVVLHPGYAHALPCAALGIFYSRSVALGGDPLRAQKYFKKAIRLTQRRYLLWLVAYAERWAWQFQQKARVVVRRGEKKRIVTLKPRDKKALFVELLDEVRRFRLDRWPQQRLANLLAKRRARRIRSKIALFLSSNRKKRVMEEQVKRSVSK
jgi:hypothetical protein